MSTQTDQKTRLFNRFDLLVMIGAIVTLFVALGDEPWWTLNGATTSRLFTIQVSPFFVRINANGLPPTVPLANSLGSFTRTFLLVGFVALFVASIRPTAWWRTLAVYFGLSSLAELYLSFLLMFYWAESAFVNTYGAIPPYFGTTTLRANIIGLDLGYYTSPLITATFNLPYYLGFVSIAFVLGRSLVKTLHERSFHALAALLPGGAIHDIYLTPPYHQIWFSSGDKEFNPMQTDPEGLTDDELLVSFQKLYETVEPGGSLSIILPDWATNLTNRLETLMPQTGFVVEKTGTIYRTQGKPENELRFRKPNAEQASTGETEAAVDAPPIDGTPSEELHLEASSPKLRLAEGARLEGATSEGPSREGPPLDLVSPTESPREMAEKVQDASQPTPKLPESIVQPDLPLLEVAEEPVWTDTRMTRLERSILKAAVRSITEHHKPVAYRELLNQVYMDLVDHEIEFDSARQIETTLLNRNGRELLLVEETDDTGSRTVKKWWLGDQKISPDKTHGFPGLEQMKKVKPKLPSIKKIFKRPRKPRYKHATEIDEDASSESTQS